MSTVLALLQAFSALPKIADFIKGIIAGYLAWIDLKEKERIELGAHKIRMAKTPDEKRKALRDWVNATH